MKTLCIAVIAHTAHYVCCRAENQKLIYVYNTDGCQVSTDSGSITLQSIDAREKTLGELSRRVRNLYATTRKKTESDEPDEEIVIKTQFLPSLQFEMIEMPDGASEDEILELSTDLPCVEEVVRDGVKNLEPDVPDEDWGGEIRRLLAEPSDPYLEKQWALLSENKWGIDAQSAWGTHTGSDIVVAVIDSGCDLHHPDIQGNLWVNRGEMDCYNGIDDDNNGYIDDCYGWDWVDDDNNPSPRSSGHGTGAAGIIGSTTNNAVGIAGICWFCKIMCLRFISGTEGKISNQVAAIDYAIRNGAKISNNSYGGYGYSQLEFRAIQRAKLYGHLFVTSAGNSNLDTDDAANDHTPSIYNLDNILALGASTLAGSKARFSNYGKSSVDLFAPGVKIQTTADGGRYAEVSGTSFAAPMGAGVAALIWTHLPELRYTEVREAIIRSCKPNTSLKGLATCGGVLDTAAALEAAEEILRTRNDSGNEPEDKPIIPVPKKASNSSKNATAVMEPLLTNLSPATDQANGGSSLYNNIIRGSTNPFSIFARLFGMSEAEGFDTEIPEVDSTENGESVKATENAVNEDLFQRGGLGSNLLAVGSTALSNTLNTFSRSDQRVLREAPVAANLRQIPTEERTLLSPGIFRDTILPPGGANDGMLISPARIPRAAMEAGVNLSRQSSSSVGAVVNGLMSSFTSKVGGAMERMNI